MFHYRSREYQSGREWAGIQPNRPDDPVTVLCCDTMDVHSVAVHIPADQREQVLHTRVGSPDVMVEQLEAQHVSGAPKGGQSQMDQPGGRPPSAGARLAPGFRTGP